jgi:3-oxoacyl-[acyl-carrier-protein] synthase II
MGSHSTQRRVVITGLGVVTPLGNQPDVFWNNIVAGQCGIDRISAFDATPFETQIAGEVKNFDPTPAFPSPKEVRHTDRFSQFGVFAAHHALLDSGLVLDRENCDEIGVIIGSGIGGLATTTKQHKILIDRGPDRLSPFMIPMLISNMASGLFSMFYNLRDGQPRHRRSLARHQNGRRAGHVCRRRGGGGCAHRHRWILRHESHEPAQ